MKIFKKCTAVLLAMLMLCSFLHCAAVEDVLQADAQEIAAQEPAPEETAAQAETEAPAGPEAPFVTKIEGTNKPGRSLAPQPITDQAPAVHIIADSTEVRAFSRLQLRAEVTGVEGEPSYRWDSSKKAVATVNNNGQVFGLIVGTTTITVTADVDGQSLTDSVDIYVVQPFGEIHNFLRDHEVLGYQYSYPDDYYYTNDKKCWQKYFGFSKFYDLVSPYILLEYDYVRVYFTYQDKDWMIQFWKGQYGLIFYGCEVGVYNRRHSSKEPGVFTLYNCAKEGDWLNMEQSLYHDTTGLGTYKREFSRNWGKYWWCTGFKRGHLRIEEPARELRSVGTIEMKDQEMLNLFTAGLEQCGFTRVEYGAELGHDCFSVDGLNVHFSWQDISHAETTMPVKALAAANVLAALCGPFALAGMFFLDIGLLLLL